MKVKIAVQVLSNTVAAALVTYINLKDIPSSPYTTVTYIKNFDKLFNLFNSSSVSGPKVMNKAFVRSQQQITFLNNIVKYLK